MQEDWRHRLRKKAISLNEFMPVVFWLEGVVLFVFFPWLLLLPFVILAVVMVTSRWKRKSSLRRRGYWVFDNKYEEATGDGSQKHQLPKEMWGPGEAALLIPSRKDWNATAPPWASDRRDEICNRILAGSSPSFIKYPEDWEGPRADPSEYRFSFPRLLWKLAVAIGVPPLLIFIKLS